MMRESRGSKSRFSRVFCIVLAFMVIASVLPQIACAQNSAPRLTKWTVTPRKGYPDIDYVFSVTYIDSDNDPPSTVKVYIDQIDYDMEEVDPSDTNYTDGKDYFLKRIMGEGTYVIYYSADDGHDHPVTSTSFTLDVTWNVGHYDIIHYIEEDVYPGLFLLLSLVFLTVLVLCIILALNMMQLRKIRKGMQGGGGEEKDKVDGEKETREESED